MKKQKNPHAEFQKVLIDMIKDIEFDEHFSGLGGNTFNPIDFPTTSKYAIMNKLLLIVAVQERSEFRFNGHTISRIAKRKAEKCVKTFLMKTNLV